MRYFTWKLDFISNILSMIVDFITVVCLTHKVDLSLHHPGITSQPAKQVR